MRIKALAVPDLVALLFALAVASPTLSCGGNSPSISQTQSPTQVAGTPLPLTQDGTVPAVPDPVEVYVMSVDGQPRLLTTLSSVPTWAWTPDDDHAALITDPNTGSAKIHVISVKAGIETASTDDVSYPWWMEWSPDGQWLAWEGYTPHGIAIETMRADGTDRRQLASSDALTWPGHGTIFDWSDNHTLLATVWEKPNRLLFEFDVANGTEREVGVQPRASWAVLSRDASRVVFIAGGTADGCPSGSGSGLWVMDVSDGNLRQVLPATCVLNSASWSPDGSQIAYGVGGSQGVSGTYILDVASGVSRKIDTPPTLFDHVDGWSPDGSTVMAYRSKCDVWGTCDEPLPALVLIPVAGGSERIISGKGNYGDYEFSSDGGALAFNNDGLQVVQLPDGTVRQAMAADADWQFDLLGWSPDGQWFAFARSRSAASR